MPQPTEQHPQPKHLKGPGGWVLATIYIALVLGIVYSAMPFDVRPASALASATGIAATAMILAQFVTSGRFQRISGKIGLDVTMGFHRIAAAGILFFVLVHILAMPFREGMPGVAMRVFRRLENLLSAQGNLTGLLAFVLLIALFVAAKWFRGKAIRYPIWRISHGVASLLVVFLVLDHILRREDTILAPLPASLLLLLSVLAAGSLAAIYILRPFRAYGHGFLVESATKLSPSVVQLTLKAPTEKSFAFDAGQFAWITLNGRHPVTDNPFSIASAPEDLPRLTFLIREAGDMTKSVVSLKPGTKVAVDGPYGNFVETQAATGIVLVAGGIGIAPILSILKSAANRSDKRPYHLVYATRSANEIVALDELRILKNRLDLKISIFVEKGPLPEGTASGLVSADNLKPLLNDFDCTNGLVFLCGPPAMMDTVTEGLLKCGFPAERVIAERFDYDAAQDPISRSVRRRFFAILAFIGVGLALAGFI